MSNTNYYRTRRELFDQFTHEVMRVPPLPHVPVSQEAFVVVRSFLTARNDSLNDDKRLAFDKVVLDLRNAAAGFAA